jgi:transcriptional regulator with GAF, ATPase, and Fis domain
VDYDRILHSAVRILSCGASPDATVALQKRLRSLEIPVSEFAATGQSTAVILAGSHGDELTEVIRNSTREGARALVVDCSSGASRSRNGWNLLEAGASDVIDYSDAVECARAVACRVRRWDEVDCLSDSPVVRDLAVGRSPAWRRVIRDIVEIAAFTVAPILIMGESGTGKELVARLVHTLDRRRNKGELVLLDCSTIVAELSGSEFFGHEKGAYTGATGLREGGFALADRGTLFLDEVGELPLTLQAQLLRAVQEKTYKRLGSNVWRQTDFRLICATNRELAAEVEGGFRRDLYYRIASWTCRLPPLRERQEDILPLARHFLGGLSTAPDFDTPVADYLLARNYPGNVRDLRQIVARMAYRHEGAGPITIGDLPADDRPVCVEAKDWRDAPFRRSVQRALSLGSGLKEIGHAAEDVAEELALEEAEGNLQRAARRLRITDRALQLRRQARRQAAG